MGLGWLCCFVEKSDRIVLAGWIVSLDIPGSRLYRLDWMDYISWIGLDYNGWTGDT